MFKKIASNTLTQVASKIITAVISIFLLSILTNYLSIEIFGLYSKVYNYLGIFAFLADLGLYTIMIREISHLNGGDNNSGNSGVIIREKEKIVGNILTLRILLGTFIILLALGVAYFLPGYNSLLELKAITIVGVFTLVSLMNSTFLAYMQSQLQMEFSLVSVVLGKIVNLGIIIAIVCFYYTHSSEVLLILGAGLIGIMVNTFLNYWYVNKSLHITMKFDREYISHIFKISLPYGIALFLSVVYFKIDIIILSLLEGERADTSIALYSLPMKIIEVLMVMGGFYLNSILPKLSSLFKSKGKIPEIQDILIISFKVLFAFGVMVFVFGLAFRDHVVLIIANQEYLIPLSHIYSSSDAFIIVLAVLLFYSLSLLFIYIFIAAEKQSILLKINIGITLFNIVGNIVIIPYYSFMGAGIITLISQVILFIVTYSYSRKIIIFKIPSVFIGKIILLGGLCYSVLYYTMSSKSLGIYGDVIIYGVIMALFYSFVTLYELKRK